MNLAWMVKTTSRGVKDHRVPDLAAMLTYYVLFAMFPFMLFLVTLTLLVLPADTLTDAFGLAATTMPKQVRTLAYEQLVRMQQSSSGGFAVVGAVLALWGASRGVVSLKNALNQIHEVKETRPWWKIQLGAVAMTLSASVLAITAFALLVFGEPVGRLIAEKLYLGWAFDVAWTIGRWVGAAALVMLVWGCLYYFLPNIKRPFRWVTPGATVGVLLWLGASRLFILYVENFGKYDKTYGALGAVIVFITWLWLSNLCFLVGGEVDDTFDEWRRIRKEGKDHVREEGVVDKIVKTTPRPVTTMSPNQPVGDIARRIGDDLSTLAKDHMELARHELGKGLKLGVADASVTLLGSIVALIGFAMLCTAAVVGLEPLIEPLWLRLVLMSAIYLAIGGLVVFLFVKKLRGDMPPDLRRSRREARKTMTALKEQMTHG